MNKNNLKLKTVYLHFYDQQNLGDDLFVLTVAKRYMNTFYTCSKHKWRCIDNLVRKGGLVSLSIDRIANKLFNKRPFFQSYTASCDYMLYIGGSLFIDNGYDAARRREADFYSSLKRPYFILGSNVGPYKSQSFLTTIRPIFENAKDVCFRDSASYKLYEYLPNTRLATDIIFTLDTEKYLVGDDNKKSVVFSVVDAYKKFDEETAATYEKLIASLAEDFTNEGRQIVFMSFCKAEGDEVAIERIIKSLPKSIASSVRVHYYSGDIDAALSEIASSEIIVGTRFHALILGLLFSKKVLPMAYSDKTTNILSDMNFQGPVVDLRKITEFESSAFDFDSLCINDISKQRQIAELQFQELDKVLVKRK